MGRNFMIGVLDDSNGLMGGWVFWTMEFVNCMPSTLDFPRGNAKFHTGFYNFSLYPLAAEDLCLK